jgi:hypothetical protein
MRAIKKNRPRAPDAARSDSLDPIPIGGSHIDSPDQPLQQIRIRLDRQSASTVALSNGSSSINTAAPRQRQLQNRHHIPATLS